MITFIYEDEEVTIPGLPESFYYEAYLTPADVMTEDFPHSRYPLSHQPYHFTAETGLVFWHQHVPEKFYDLMTDASVNQGYDYRPTFYDNSIFTKGVIDIRDSSLGYLPMFQNLMKRIIVKDGMDPTKLLREPFFNIENALNLRDVNSDFWSIALADSDKVTLQSVNNANAEDEDLEITVEGSERVSIFYFSPSNRLNILRCMLRIAPGFRLESAVLWRCDPYYMLTVRTLPNAPDEDSTVGLRYNVTAPLFDIADFEINESSPLSSAPGGMSDPNVEHDFESSIEDSVSGKGLFNLLFFTAGCVFLRFLRLFRRSD